MKILVTGGYGMMGRTIHSLVNNNSENANDYVFLSRKDCDLTDRQNVLNYFKENKFDYIIHLAAAVGGLYKNLNANIDMFSKNIKINENVLEACNLNGIKRGIFCLSSCIYPSNPSKFPMDETMIHESPPHHSNEGYAYAKRMLEVQSNAYNEQYGTNYVCVIPTNIYGPHDNYSLEDGHVIPALIHKCLLNKQNNEKFVVRGTGKPLRQFIYSEDLAELIKWTLFEYNEKSSIILSVSEKDEVSIKDVAEEIANAYDYGHMIEYDTSFSDGQFKKTADNTKLMSYLPEFIFTSMHDGIVKSVRWFEENFEEARK